MNRPEYSIPVTLIRSINRREDFEACNAEVIEESNDPYATNRDIYLEQRQRDIDILRGRVPDPLPFQPTDSEDGNAGETALDCTVAEAQRDDFDEPFDEPAPSPPESANPDDPSVSYLLPARAARKSAAF